MFPKFMQVGLNLTGGGKGGGGGAYIQGAYIWDVKWVTYLGSYILGGFYTGRLLMGFYGLDPQLLCLNPRMLHVPLDVLVLVVMACGG